MNSKKITRRAYVTEMILVAICGVLPSIILVFTDGYQFRLGFPPFCAPTNIDILFPIVLMPLTLGSAVGLSLLFASFWILNRVSTYLCTVNMYMYTCNVHLCLYIFPKQNAILTHFVMSLEARFVSELNAD